MASPPPLTGLRVLEFAGLAPGPFAGMILADYGASVMRIDRAVPNAHTSTPPPPTADNLVRHKASICIDFKSPSGVRLLLALLPYVDVVIDPFRPGVLERLGLCPTTVLLRANPRLIVARMTGFRRDGPYASMAGHDINYIAVSGALGLLGRAGTPPHAPANMLGDFAGGGAVCAIGVLLALAARERSGRGQVVEANMVDGSAYMATFPRLAAKTPMMSGERGTNMLDGGSPFYDTYETSDAKYMSVGALEPQFFAALLRGLSLSPQDLGGSRDDRATWPRMRQLFAARFRSRTRAHWEAVFAGSDACCTPVLTQRELEAAGYRQRPLVTLRGTPGLAVGAPEEEEQEGAGRRRRPEEGQGDAVEGEGYSAKGLRPGVGGEEVLERWCGWVRGREYEVGNGGLALKDGEAKAKL